MFRFWPTVIKPLLDAVSPKSIIEIGAGTGKNSLNLALWARAQKAELHIVDPEPDFDMAHLADRFRDSTRVHFRPSLEVLEALLPADVVLVDGDHNWYTVFHEMRLLFGEDAGTEHLWPVAICHDVEWPYGRRDLYYVPERIPELHRQPMQRGPLSPHERGLTLQGMNADLCHARQEGGPRNGVRTAIEDALSDREDLFRILWIPVLHGLAVIVPRARLSGNDALSDVLGDLEVSRRMRSICRLVELERCNGLAALGVDRGTVTD